MGPTGAELAIAVVAAAALLLAPLASRLINSVGAQISAELDGGRTGSDLTRHLDRRYGERGGGPATTRDDEIRQLLRARAFVQAERGEPVLDVEAELERIRRAESAGG